MSRYEPLPQFLILRDIQAFSERRENLWGILREFSKEGKSLAGALYKEEKRINRDKECSCLNWKKKSSQLLPSCHHHVRLPVLKRFSAFRNFLDKLYVSNIKKEKKKQKRKVAFVTWKMPWLAQILQQSRDRRQVSLEMARFQDLQRPLQFE